MLRNIHTHRTILLLLVFCVTTFVAVAQRGTSVVGWVVDSLSNEPLPNVSIVLGETGMGTMTDANGYFDIQSQLDFDCVRFSTLGYNAHEVAVKKGRNNRLRVYLSPTYIPLDEVLVQPSKEKYSKKNNPAVDLARRLIDMRQVQDSLRPQYFAQRKYEKTAYAIDRFTDFVRANPIVRQAPFLMQYVDTSDVTHNPILNLVVTEKITDCYSQRTPRKVAEIPVAVKREGLEGFFDKENLQALSDEMLREVDLYSNDITLFDQQFVSPLSQHAISFYKYYLLDTLDIDGEKCIDLGFASYNPQSMGFAGHLYVVIEDSSYFVKRARYTVPRDINLNYVSRMILRQDYCRDSLGVPVKVYDDVVVEFSIARRLPGLYARRSVHYSHFSYDEPAHNTFDTSTYRAARNATGEQGDDFWQEHRPMPLRRQEASVDELSYKLQEIPFIKAVSKTIHTFSTGYIATHAIDKKSRFDIGPFNTFISGNSIEGLRLKLGGTTTAKLLPHLFLSGYAAYGFDDNKWKYAASLEYSFNRKRHSALEYPIHSIKAYYQYDLNFLAQRYIHSLRDNFVLSLRRAPDYNATYMRTCGVTYKHEFLNGLSLELGVRNERQESTPHLPFNILHNDGTIESHASFSQTMGEVLLQYCPTDNFYSAYGVRYPISSDAVSLSLRHIFAIKGLGSRYDYHHTEMAVSKRFRMSKWGYIDAIAKGGVVWNNVPYPLLIIPYANMSYTISPESYSLLSPMEFIFDRYVACDITYFANGLLFNRIPFINKLALREVVSFRAIYGSITDNNYYPEQTGMYLFNPEWEVKRMNGAPPYMEMSVGIDNIFSILRIDYVFRLTYRDAVNADIRGVRVGLHVTF
ncbi:MAG: carboxypeptidase-like regulatory domain-containing protein [Bacteroidaceae bacterium]|nr:carboxypeptidase-like regulatory domain-containing protein [Bacteroidaceae bacterium]